MSSSESASSESRFLDPVLVHARREAVIILTVFGVCLIWSVSWCYWTGYNLPPDQPVAKVLGIPSWIFWGVVVPWLLADIFTIWFCLSYMAMDPLGEETAADAFSMSGVSPPAAGDGTAGDGAAGDGPAVDDGEDR